MADVDFAKITAAANAVIQALADLSPEERERVLDSASALYGIAAKTSAREPRQEPASRDEQQSHHREGDRPGKRLSIVEFLNEKQPATNAQRIACFAYYREHVEGRPQFARRDLEPYFAAAKLANPGKNFDREFNKAVREGWIHEDGANSYLTQGGENKVNAGFGGKAKPRGSAASTKKGKKSAATTP